MLPTTGVVLRLEPRVGDHLPGAVETLRRDARLPVGIARRDEVRGGAGRTLRRPRNERGDGKTGTEVFKAETGAEVLRRNGSRDRVVSGGRSRRHVVVFLLPSDGRGLSQETGRVLEWDAVTSAEYCVCDRHLRHEHRV